MFYRLSCYRKRLLCDAIYRRYHDMPAEAAEVEVGEVESG